MHSSPYYSLVKQALTDDVFGIGSLVVSAGRTETLGRPTLISDSTALKTTGGSPDPFYSVLGLAPDAIVITISEEQEIVTQDVTGLDNLVIRVQGEYSYNLGLKGYKWDITNGAANPNSTAVATGSNWDKSASDDKDTAGVCVKVG
jgi:hypothetical protein